MVEGLGVDVGVQSIVLDEFATRFHDITHQFGEQIVGIIAMFDLDLQQGAGIGVQCGFPQLVGVHLTQTLIALNRNALLASIEDGI